MADIQTETTWFLAQLKPNSAKIAQTNLQRQKFETFLPLEEETRQRNGRFITSLRPLFPGYLFVALDTAQGLWRAVNSTQGITKLVSFGKQPAPVPQDLVTQLMLRCDEAGKVLPPSALQPGDQVALTQGPFAHFAAEIEKIAPDRRVWVLIDLMGRRTRVAVDEGHLKAV